MTPRTAIPKRRRKPRRGPMREPKYRAWLHVYGVDVATFPRFNPHAMMRVFGELTKHNYCECAHGPVNGLSSKGPDNECIPLSPERHREQHQIGWPAFEKKYGFDRKAKAAEWYAAYQLWKQKGKAA